MLVKYFQTLDISSACTMPVGAIPVIVFEEYLKNTSNAETHETYRHTNRLVKKAIRTHKRKQLDKNIYTSYGGGFQEILLS